MDQFARMFALGAAHRFGRLQGGQSVKTKPSQDAADGGSSSRRQLLCRAAAALPQLDGSATNTAVSVTFDNAK
jgi:hypothetical protein